MPKLVNYKCLMFMIKKHSVNVEVPTTLAALERHLPGLYTRDTLSGALRNEEMKKSWKNDQEWMDVPGLPLWAGA